MQQVLLYLVGRVDRALATGKYGVKTRSGMLRLSLDTQIEGEGHNLRGIVGSNLAYAAIQERGGTTHPTVTPQLRRFMFAKYYETGDDKFLHTAITKKDRLDVTIKPHWYMRNTLKAEKRTILRYFEQALSKAL